MKIDFSELFTELVLITLFTIGLSFFAYAVYDVCVVAAEVERIRSLY